MANQPKSIAYALDELILEILVVSQHLGLGSLVFDLGGDKLLDERVAERPIKRSQ